jgi:hypothetical protein
MRTLSQLQGATHRSLTRRKSACLYEFVMGFIARCSAPLHFILSGFEWNLRQVGAPSKTPMLVGYFLLPSRKMSAFSLLYSGGESGLFKTLEGHDKCKVQYFTLCTLHFTLFFGGSKKRKNTLYLKNNEGFLVLSLHAQRKYQRKGSLGFSMTH